MTQLALDTIRRRAQDTANRKGHAVVILNLNRFSPMYAIREDRPGIDSDRAFIERVQPQEA